MPWIRAPHLRLFCLVTPKNPNFISKGIDKCADNSHKNQTLKLQHTLKTMKSYLPYLIILLLAVGCANTLPQQAPGTPILGHPAPQFKADPSAYEMAAWHLFSKSDYVRALRFAYHAAEIQPNAPSAALLVGLIYDQGFDRPDLALQAYNHILQQAPNYQGVQVLQPRLPYLFRRTQERAAQITFTQHAPPPLQATDLAIFPIQSWMANKNDTAFALGLTDLLFSHFVDSTSSLPSLRTHLLAHAYLTAIPDADGKSFAQWAGAQRTLSGTLIKEQNHQVTIQMTLYDANGQETEKIPPVVGSMNHLEKLQEALTSVVANALESPIQSPTLPLTSSLAVTLHGQALDAYLSGDPERALEYFSGALQLAPETTRILELQRWIDADYVGSHVGNDLVALYRFLKTQPDPDEAATRRILATQNLLIPTSSLDTATDPQNPFKPPHPENAP